MVDKEKETRSNGAIDNAAALAAFQKKLDLVSHAGIKIGEPGSTSWPAQYAAVQDPPHVLKLKYFNQMRTMYPGAAGTAPQVNISFDDEDVKAMKTKEQVAGLADFDAWITERYHPWSNPVFGQWLKTRYESYFTARLAENKTTHALKEQWEAMQISGPNTLEDLYLIYRTEIDPELAYRLGANQPAPTGEGVAAKPHFYNIGRMRRNAPAMKAMGMAAELDHPAEDWRGTEQHRSMYTTPRRVKSEQPSLI